MKQNIYKYLDNYSDDEILEEKKIKNKVKLWYDKNTWQYKLIKNQYIFEDKKSVLEVYDLLYLHKKYLKATNNFIKNKCFMKMMLVITQLEWNNIKNLVKLNSN